MRPVFGDGTNGDLTAIMLNKGFVGGEAACTVSQ